MEFWWVKNTDRRRRQYWQNWPTSSSWSITHWPNNCKDRPI